MELEKGRAIQQDFLPRELPRHPNWDIATRFQPAREVSGDFYDVFDLPGGMVGLVIADVCFNIGALQLAPRRSAPGCHRRGHRGAQRCR